MRNLEFDVENADWVYTIFGVPLLNKLILAATSHDLECQSIQEAAEQLNVRMQSYPSSAQDRSLVLTFFHILE